MRSRGAIDLSMEDPDLSVVQFNSRLRILSIDTVESYIQQLDLTALTK